MKMQPQSTCCTQLKALWEVSGDRTLGVGEVTWEPMPASERVRVAVICCRLHHLSTLLSVLPQPSIWAVITAFWSVWCLCPLCFLPPSPPLHSPPLIFPCCWEFATPLLHQHSLTWVVKGAWRDHNHMRYSWLDGCNLSFSLHEPNNSSSESLFHAHTG